MIILNVKYLKGLFFNSYSFILPYFVIKRSGSTFYPNSVSNGNFDRARAASSFVEKVTSA